MPQTLLAVHAQQYTLTSRTLTNTIENAYHSVRTLLLQLTWECIRIRMTMPVGGVPIYTLPRKFHCTGTRIVESALSDALLKHQKD